jgi:hypothetical protein
MGEWRHAEQFRFEQVICIDERQGMEIQYAAGRSLPPKVSITPSADDLSAPGTFHCGSRV